MQPKKRALGRGLSALLPPRATPEPESGSVAVLEDSPSASPDGRVFLPVDSISPNSYQPRHHFDENALQELAGSIRENGIIQPVVVCRRGEGYMLVAGERRWRAARIAGLTEVPTVILALTEKEMLEFALIENLQRENLNPMEESRAYKALIDTFGLSQEEVADRVGKGRPTIANALRLLRLPLEYQKDIEAGTLSAGHARAVLSLSNETDQKRLRDTILKEALSVREAERLAVELANRASRHKPMRMLDPNIQRLREQIIERLTCRVQIKTFDHNKGKIEIYYDSLDELERFLEAIGVEG